MGNRQALYQSRLGSAADAVGLIRSGNRVVAGPASRKAIQEGCPCFTLAHFSRIPGLFMDDILPVDVALCMVSPPMSMGSALLGSPSIIQSRRRRVPGCHRGSHPAHAQDLGRCADSYFRDRLHGGVRLQADRTAPA
jgi:hypothetical protein